MSVVTEAGQDSAPEAGAENKELPELPEELPTPLATAPELDPLHIYKMVVQSTTEQANTPEFRERFQAYLKIINPDGDDHVTGEEMAQAMKSMIVSNTEKLNAMIKEELDRGTPPEEVAKQLEAVGSPRFSNTGTPADFSSTAWLEKAAQECSTSPQASVSTDDLNAKMLQEVVKNYPDIVAALQLRSGFIGDLVLSDETKALIPKLHPEDAYSLPLFVSLPSKDQVCQVYKDSAQEVSRTDPLRPLDTPKAPDRSPESEKSR